MPFVSILLTAVLFAAAGQATPLPPEAKEFDFWVGHWKCTGETHAPNDQVTKTEAENTIRRILDGHVVEESFKMGAYLGRSNSLYDPAAKLWRQTWVDNQDGYIALTGGMKDGKMTLTTIANTVHPKSVQRMIFENIEKNSFDWNWQTSSDGGVTWQLSWHLHYARNK